MLGNYFKIAFRNLFKNKVYSSINILGLAVGLATCIVILLYVSHELSYDKHHSDSDRTYRVTSHIDFGGNFIELASTSAPMGPTLKELYPEVEAMTRLRPRGSYLIKKEGKNYREHGFVFADSSVFDVFTIPFLYGEPDCALTQPQTVAISEEMARKYFGRADVVGETITIQDDFDMEITGVYETMPNTSHFHFNFLISMATIDEANNNVWLSNNFRTYLLLRENTDPKAFEENFEYIKKTYIEPQLLQFMGITMKEFEEAGNRADYRLQPLEDIHLHSSLTGEFKANGSITYVYIFSGLAVFILLLACINFMNLSTARSAKRAKEVGVRKSLGSDRSTLARQFLMESLLLSFLGLIVALLFVELTLPYFSDIAGRTISSQYFTNLPLSLGMLGIVIITGLLAGAYPAALLSSFQPVKVLKGTHLERKGHGLFRKGLVVFQFSISIVIIAGLLVINNQLRFIQNKNIGFEKDQVVIVEDAYAIGSSNGVDSYKDEVLKSSFIKSATISSFFPVDGYSLNDLAYWPEGASPTQNNTVSLQTWEVDEHYVPTLEMEIIEGRNFSEDRSMDGQAVILNETAVQRLGLEDPVGKSISTYAMNHEDGSIDQSRTRTFKIVGVVKDFNYESLRENVSPLGLFNQRSSGNIAFRFADVDVSEVLAVLEAEWTAQAPEQPFNYAFLDQQFDRMYRAESRIQNLMSTFSVLAILIACLGLFGLSAFSAEKRAKEIGIRKVLGADIVSVLRLISKEYMALIIISFIISAPIAYLVMQQWLQQFTYRIDLGISVFLISGLITLGIAIATVSWQSVKAALTNPINSLRNE
ncbi:ABC transporter permease [Gracilimonas sp. BCB1]|uniref:ABC transporter permease n=1 Tax=Gracilimonas sp. BCB1 TaxID=3152362 RepID=UPI0032D8ED65